MQLPADRIREIFHLSGCYSGVIATYDWSGSVVIREEPLSVSFSKHGDDYLGLWMQGSDTISVRASMDEDGRLMFADSRMSVSDRYTEGKKIECVFDNAELALAGPSLTGGLRLFSLTQNEPMRPMYLSLSKATSDDDNDDRYHCALFAYPVPGTGQVELRFSLPEDVREASVSISDRSGVFTKSFRLGSLRAGQQRFTINTNLSSGLYIVNMRADRYRGQATIMLN